MAKSVESKLTDLSKSITKLWSYVLSVEMVKVVAYMMYIKSETRVITGKHSNFDFEPFDAYVPPHFDSNALWKSTFQKWDELEKLIYERRKKSWDNLNETKRQITEFINSLRK